MNPAEYEAYLVGYKAGYLRKTAERGYNPFGKLIKFYLAGVQDGNLLRKGYEDTPKDAMVSGGSTIRATKESIESAQYLFWNAEEMRWSLHLFAIDTCTTDVYCKCIKTGDVYKRTTDPIHGVNWEMTFETPDNYLQQGELFDG